MSEIIEIGKIKKDVSELGKEYGAERIYLFGSYARGEALSDSDIDLRIDKGKIRGLIKLAGLKNKLEERLGCRVDLLTTDSLDNSFLNKIANEEVLLYGSK